MFPLIKLSSSVQVPTYYLIISCAVSLCLLWLHRRVNKSVLSHRVALDLSLIIMITGFVGGRLMHVFYESFDYYREDFNRIFYFWDGGFVFYGGAFLAAFFSLIFLKIKAPSKTLQYLDLFSPVTSLAYALGRIACLFAGCCYGRYCDLPWAIAGRHPTQAYATAWELLVVLLLVKIETTAFAKTPGRVFFIWMILHGLGRMMMEYFRDDFRGPLVFLSISSWISLAVIATGLLLLWHTRPTSGSTTRKP